MGEEERKKRISRAFCQRELRNLAVLDCRLHAIGWVISVATCLPLVRWLSSFFHRLPILTVGGILILLAPAVCFTVLLIGSAVRLRRVAKGEFAIVVDDVCEISRGEPQGRSTVDALYFTRYGRYVSGGVYFELTELRDEYYLVVLKGKKTAELAYSKKFYDCDAEEVFFE